jgi:hypothetical protein
MKMSKPGEIMAEKLNDTKNGYIRRYITEKSIEKYEKLGFEIRYGMRSGGWTLKKPY